MSCLIFTSFSNFEFILVHGVKVCSSFIDLHAAVQISQQCLLKRLFVCFFFPILCSCCLCQRLIDHRCLGIFLYSLFFPLFCMSVLVTVSHCLDDCGFVILPEVRSVSQSNRNKNKNKPMGPNQTCKLLYSKANHKKRKKDNLWNGRK